MKRLSFAVFLVLAIALLLLAGCGDNEHEAGNSSPDNKIFISGDPNDKAPSDDDDDMVIPDDDDATTDDDDIVPNDDDAVDDDDSTPVAGVTGRFDLSESDGFYSLPFPIDLRIKADGTIRVADFPNPRGSIMLGKYIDLAEKETHGFGADSGIFFSFTGSVDADTFPESAEASLLSDATVFVVSIDPTSPDYAKRYPVRIKYTGRETCYGPKQMLAVLPVQGVPLLPGQKYAAIVTTDVKDSHGNNLTPNPEFYDVLTGESDNTTAVELFEPMSDYLVDANIEPENVVVGTVFTTGTPMTRMLAMRDHVYSYDLPGIDPDSLVQDSVTDNYVVLRGEVTIPIYQKGEVPYILEGGGIEFDGQGRPIVQWEWTIRMAMSVPRQTMPATGWPLIIYSHGSGGSYKSFLNKGVADRFAQKGIAVVSIDAPHHGMRNPISDDSGFESFCFYNALNPEAFRDNNVQAATELMAVLRQALELEFTSDLLIPPPPEEKSDPSYTVHFDAANAYFMGHSQGSTVGPLMVATDPTLRAAYFSGAGASLLWNLLTKQEPFPIPPLLRVGLKLDPWEAKAHLDEFHPALNLLQHMAEVVDPMSFGRYYYENNVPNAPPKHVFQAIGVTDSYVGLPCHGSFAASGRMDMIEPLYGTDAWWRVGLAGGALLDGSAVTGNRQDEDGNPMTAIAVEYPAPENGADGHYVSFNFPSLKRRIACYFATAIKNGVPTIVEASDDENAPCE